MHRFAVFSLDGPVGHLEDPHQLLILQKGAPVGFTPLPGHDRLIRRIGRLQHIRHDMRHPRHLIPPDGMSGAVAAKDRIGGIFRIGVTVVAAGGYYRFGVPAGRIAVRLPG